MNQEDLIQASLIEREYRELENNLQLIDAQIQELEKFKEDLDFLTNSKNREMLAQIGRGVYISSSIEDKKKLFIEVGSGVVVKKTPEEAQKIIAKQISHLRQAHMQMLSHLESYQSQLNTLINKIESTENK